MTKYRALSTPIAGLIFALLGLSYSIFMGIGVGTEFICPTSGCAVVHDFKLLGVSPWWGSTAIFALISLFCVVRLRGVAQVVSFFFLFGDCLFLFLMIFLAPCTSCLIVAPLILLTWVTLRRRPLTLAVPRLLLDGGISLVWFLLFVLNLGPVISEIAPLWSMNFTAGQQSAQADGDAGPRITVYFSPTCAACQEAVAAFKDKATYYPVAKSGDDFAMIADLETRHAAGQDLLGALRELSDLNKQGGYTPPELSVWKSFKLQVLLMRNQGRLTRQKFSALPVIMFEGMPLSWAEAREKAAAASGSPDLPPDLRDSLECGPGKPPCP